MVEGLVVSVIPNAKLPGVLTFVGPPIAVKSKMEDQAECDQAPKDPNSGIGNDLNRG